MDKEIYEIMVKAVDELHEAMSFITKINFDKEDIIDLYDSKIENFIEDKDKTIKSPKLGKGVRTFEEQKKYMIYKYKIKDTTCLDII